MKEARESNRPTSVRMPTDATSYVEKKKYGGAGFDDEEEDSDDEHDPNFQASTPLTR